MYENIRRHSFMVARVAAEIHAGLMRASTGNVLVPGRELVIAGALLHDIAKTQCLQEDCVHADVGREICLELGLVDIAEIVADHVVLSRFSEQEYRRGIFSATDLVFYADKRVKHDTVVSLAERLEYIIEKYSNNEAVREERIRQNFSQCQRVETHLFARLDFSPDDIEDRIRNTPPELDHYPPA